MLCKRSVPYCSHSWLIFIFHKSGYRFSNWLERRPSGPMRHSPPCSLVQCAAQFCLLVPLRLICHHIHIRLPTNTNASNQRHIVHRPDTCNAALRPNSLSMQTNECERKRCFQSKCTLIPIESSGAKCIRSSNIIYPIALAECFASVGGVGEGEGRRPKVATNAAEEQ